MNRAIVPVAFALTTAGILIACLLASLKKHEQASDRVPDGTEAIADAERALAQAIANFIRQFKKEAEAVLHASDTRIMEFKSTLSSERRDAKAMYEKRLASVETNTKDIRKKLGELADDGKDTWKELKNELSRDLNELRNSLSHFFTEEAA